jgi:hypothetical protein
MIISNTSDLLVSYEVSGPDGKVTDGGVVQAKTSVQFSPRGNGPYTVKSQSVSPTFQSSPIKSPDAIVTIWGLTLKNGGFSE